MSDKHTIGLHTYAVKDGTMLYDDEGLRWPPLERNLREAEHLTDDQFLVAVDVKSSTLVVCYYHTRGEDICKSSNEEI